MSNNQPPHLCCQMDSKAPNTHLACASNGRLGEGSWKAVEGKRSVLDGRGMAQGRGAASRAGPWLAGRASTEQREGVRDSIPMCFLVLLFTQLCDTCVLSLVQQGVRPLCLLSGLCIPQHSSSAQLGAAGGVPALSTGALQLLAQVKPVSTTTVVRELILSSEQCQSVGLKPRLLRPGISVQLPYNRRTAAN